MSKVKNLLNDVDAIAKDIYKRRNTARSVSQRPTGSGIAPYVPKLSVAGEKMYKKTAKKYGYVPLSYNKLKNMAKNPNMDTTTKRNLYMRELMSTPHKYYKDISEFDYRKRAIFRANLTLILQKMGISIGVDASKEIKDLLNINIFKFDYSGIIRPIIDSYSALTKYIKNNKIELEGVSKDARSRFLTKEVKDVTMDNIRTALKNVSLMMEPEEYNFNELSESSFNNEDGNVDEYGMFVEEYFNLIAKSNEEAYNIWFNDTNAERTLASMRINRKRMKKEQIERILELREKYGIEVED